MIGGRWRCAEQSGGGGGTAYPGKICNASAGIDTDDAPGHIPTQKPRWLDENALILSISRLRFFTRLVSASDINFITRVLFWLSFADMCLEVFARRFGGKKDGTVLY